MLCFYAKKFLKFLAALDISCSPWQKIQCTWVSRGFLHLYFKGHKVVEVLLQSDFCVKLKWMESFEGSFCREELKWFCYMGTTSVLHAMPMLIFCDSNKEVCLPAVVPPTVPHWHLAESDTWLGSFPPFLAERYWKVSPTQKRNNTNKWILFITSFIKKKKKIRLILFAICLSFHLKNSKF